MRFVTTIFCLLWALAAAASPPHPLPRLRADLSQTTVSGVSSGAYMAGQFAVAYSGLVRGVGLVAGGPYYCAGAAGQPPYVPYLVNALTLCMNPEQAGLDPPDPQLLLEKTMGFFQQGWIDDPANLARQRVYVFSGTQDQTITSAVGASARDFYLLAGAANVVFNNEVGAGHGMVTDDPHDQPCAATAPPYLNNCALPLARLLLAQLLGTLEAPSTQPEGRLLRFSQRLYAAPDIALADSGYVYVPTACQSGGCRVHVAFHACLQSADQIGERYVQGAGYNRVADRNRLIVLYPQATPSARYPYNPQGCWDFWGYASPNPFAPRFFARDGPQLLAVRAMLARLAQSP
ncbi:poly(3-hydroxybutyrate) depolymerase [Massilia sp. TS11]|uniref:extracellular catalytic domain type 2 short-chain-length polyhydroxyalkanoate depolymerase n=1 Tax=Massilia sp. TS11 TaxID=2908003 RepID=UPI001EDBAF1D|nr:poly(3-hydroxybutyrate) depolymerase [Massilia sp. TS11]MCG2585248.1 poly(3-hydroxybutyrate) depolymerase [Massilia sp. TS11]